MRGSLFICTVTSPDQSVLKINRELFVLVRPDVFLMGIRDSILNTTKELLIQSLRACRRADPFGNGRLLFVYSCVFSALIGI